MTKLKNNEKWAKWLLFHFTKERSEKRNVQNAMNCMTNIGNMFTITNMRNSYILLKELIIIIKSVPVTNQTSYIDGIS